MAGDTSINDGSGARFTGETLAVLAPNNKDELTEALKALRDAGDPVTGAELPDAYSVCTGLLVAGDFADIKAKTAAADDPNTLAEEKKLAEEKDKETEADESIAKKTPAPELKFPDLIKALGSEKFETRVEAQRKLEELGIEAAPDLKHALKDGDIEIRRRAKEGLDKIKSDLQSETLFPEKPFAQAKEDAVDLNRMDLHAFAELNKLKEFDETDAKSRLKNIEDVRQKLELLNQSLKEKGITDEITRLQALEKDYKNLAARKGEIDKLTEGIAGLSVDGTYSEAELRLISSCKNLERLVVGESTQIDKVLENANGLTKVKSINFEEGTVTNSDLAKLKGSSLEKSLTHVCLSNTNITDDGLQALTNCSGLEILRLRNTDVTDSGLKHLASMSNLRTLRLDNTLISGTGLLHLSNLTNLSDLSLRGTDITDLDLQHLRNLKNLNSLNLRKTNISSQGIEHLTALPLENLDLQENLDIDENCTKWLGAMKSLTSSGIKLQNTSVSPDGIEKLKKTNPTKEYLPD